ncbi:hypothetical protein KY284_035991 [Solanum tuberosum]|nr:hypothetical protein KY284_035991 [Solanum tuberosum]
METGSKTYPSKGKVTLESYMRTPTEESRMMRMLDGSLTKFRGRLCIKNSRPTKVEDEIWAKERESSHYHLEVVPTFLGCGGLLEEELMVHEHALIKFQTGKYHDVVLCDVIPMQASHVLLGRPWHHNHAKTHDGRNNTYTIKSMGCKYVLKTMCPSQVIELYRKMDESRDQRKKKEGDPREALSMDTLVGCPDISKGLSFQDEEDLSCRRHVCECSSLVEGYCNVIKEPQVGGTYDNVDQLIGSDSLSISIVEDSLACFAHRYHVLENALKIDMCLFEGELECFNSSLAVDPSFFKYNILFEDDEITPSDVPSGVSHESSIVPDNYTCSDNPLWCGACPPNDENLFLEDESTLVGTDCDDEEVSFKEFGHQTSRDDQDVQKLVFYVLGQNVWVRLPGTTLRVPEEDPNPWPNKLPRQLEVVHGESGSVSRTCSTNGQKVAPRRGDTADSSVSEFNLQKLQGTPPRRELVSRRNLRK